MPINKNMLSTLRKILYSEEHLSKTYQYERKMVNLTHPYILKPFFKMWDQEVVLDDHTVPVRMFFPLKDGEYPLLIFFHGGGFVTGNINSYSKVCMRMANFTKHIVLSVDYRLAPEYPFPCGLEDCYAVVKQVLTNNDVLHHKSGKITLIGDSAGANLAAAVSLLARDRGDFKVDQQILLYPATYNDHTSTSPFPSVHENGEDYLLTNKRMKEYMELYVPNKEDLKSPYVAPLLASDLSNQPDTLIITAEYDLLRDEGEAYGQKLKEAGNQVEIHRILDAVHGFITLSPLFQEVKDCYTIINRFLTKENMNESL